MWITAEADANYSITTSLRQFKFHRDLICQLLYVKSIMTTMDPSATKSHTFLDESISVQETEISYPLVYVTPVW